MGERKHAPPPVTVQGPEVTANVGGAVLRSAASCASASAQATEALLGAEIVSRGPWGNRTS